MPFFKRPRPYGYGQQEDQEQQNQQKEVYADYTYRTPASAPHQEETITGTFPSQLEPDRTYQTVHDVYEGLYTDESEDEDYPHAEEYDDIEETEYDDPDKDYDDIMEEYEEKYNDIESVYDDEPYAEENDLPEEPQTDLNDYSEADDIKNTYTESRDPDNTFDAQHTETDYADFSETTDEIQNNNRFDNRPDDEIREDITDTISDVPEDEMRNAMNDEYPEEKNPDTQDDVQDIDTEDGEEVEKMPGESSIHDFIAQVSPKAKPGGRDENGDYYRPKYPPLSKLKRIRTERQVTQKIVAEYLGITVQYYSQIERGLNILSYLNAVRLAIFFECHVDDLFLEDYSKGYEDIYRLRHNMTKRGRRKKGRQRVE